MPASRQRWNMAAEVSSSASPPKDIVPKHKFETWTPVLPKNLYSIVPPYSMGCILLQTGVAKHQIGKQRLPRSIKGNYIVAAGILIEQGQNACHDGTFVPTRVEVTGT
jgi:hypothetical protein